MQGWGTLDREMESRSRGYSKKFPLEVAAEEEALNVSAGRTDGMMRYVERVWLAAGKQLCRPCRPRKGPAAIRSVAPLLPALTDISDPSEWRPHFGLHNELMDFIFSREDSV